MQRHHDEYRDNITGTERVDALSTVSRARELSRKRASANSDFHRSTMSENNTPMSSLQSQKLGNNENADNNNYNTDKNNKEMITISIISSADSKSDNIKYRLQSSTIKSSSKCFV